MKNDYLRPQSFNLPLQLIVPTSDLLQAFFKELGPVGVSHTDLVELLTEVICILLDFDETADQRISQLPEHDRMINSGVFIANPEAVPALGNAIKQRLQELGAFDHTEFPYFFDRLLGYDLVLNRLPY